MLSSLERRLEVAKAIRNLQLVELLEDERQEMFEDGTQAEILQQDAPCKELPFSQWQSGLTKVWDGLVQIFAPQSELQIKQISDRSGNKWWYAFNPQTGQSVYCDTEDEMRLWIETN
ncbi:hypothetical protein V2H45_15055 [Tumidithrix elongata RA019]|uniref:Uncharacterized protein n=1 Tax=Tumidithrix elongata BACA0141 TaxID=2716417 RepID=A0AAW9Q4D1_9CYAN|nr:hypothetical protein [Tumidithrix elongata RA019]